MTKKQAKKTPKKLTKTQKKATAPGVGPTPKPGTNGRRSWP